MVTIVSADENWTITTDPAVAVYSVKYDRPEGCDCRPVCVIGKEVVMAGADDCPVHGFEPIQTPDLYIDKIGREIF